MDGMSINSDDLKYGIECCIKYMACSPAEECCDLCPYHGRCSGLEKDALALIQQLEANDSQVKKALQDNGFGSLEELLQAYSQVKRERDAAVADLAAIHVYSTCKHDPDDSIDYIQGVCFECCTTKCNYEWRGVPEGELKRRTNAISMR